MIGNIDISGSNFEVHDDLKKYIKKHLGKIDRFLPKGAKKDLVMKVVIEQITRDNGNKYEISAAVDIPGGKVIAAKDECINPRAGIDIVESKLLSQVRKYKTETEAHRHAGGLRSLFKKK